MYAAFFFFLSPLPLLCLSLYIGYSRGRLKSLGKISLPKGSVVYSAPLFGSTLRINFNSDHSVGECPSPVSRRQLYMIATTCRFSASMPHCVGRGAICYYAFPCGVTNFPLVSTLFYFLNQLPKRTIVNCRQQLSEDGCAFNRSYSRRISPVSVRVNHSRGLTHIWNLQYGRTK